MLIIRDFRGIVPRVNERTLKDGIAEVAQDVNVAHHDLRPYACPTEYCQKEFDIKSIHSFPECPCLAFDKRTDIAKFVSDESKVLLIKMDGAEPQIASVDDACNDIWCPLGVPCPETPPNVIADSAGECGGVVSEVAEEVESVSTGGTETNVIDSVSGASFFSLARLDDGGLLAGTYSYSSPILPAIRRDGNIELEINSGESIFSMAPQGGTLYVSTEDNGGLYSVDLSTWVATPVHTLAPGLFGGAFDVRIIDGDVICVGGGEIYVVGVGTVHTFTSDYYVKNIYKFDGTYYVPGYKASANEAGHFASTDLIAWAWEPGEPGARYMRGEVSPNGDKVAIVGTEDYSGGTHHPDSATLWVRTTSGITKEEVWPGYNYSSVAKWDNNETVVVGLTRDWQSTQPGAQIVKVPGGVVATFDEAELRDIDIYDGKYYIATRTNNVGGKVYEVSSGQACLGFEPSGTQSQILDGHDNGITAKGDDGTIWLITGDGFVGPTKYETAVFSLAPGDDPTVPGNWTFRRGLTGKCYGAKCFGNTLYLLKSDTGSLWIGTQNVRIYNFDTEVSSGTLQGALESRGINWFIVNDGGPDMTVGCVIAPIDEFYAGETPVPLWRGDPDNLGSFTQVTTDMGLPEMDATTVSVIQVDGSWVAGVGDFKRGEIHQYCASDLLGPWSLISTEVFSPPMTPEWTWLIYAGEGFTAGPFTLNYFETNGQWFRSVTGTGSDTNDGVYIQSVTPTTTISVTPPPISTSVYAGDIEYTSYRYRYVNKYGFIGAPSPYSDIIEQSDNSEITVSGFGNPGGCVTHVLVETSRHGHRTGDEREFAGESAWHVVGTIPIGEAYMGSGSSFDIGPVLGMEMNFPPPDGLLGAVIFKSGAVGGFIGKQVYISNPGQPNAFSGKYDIVLDDDIVQLVEHGEEVYAITTGHPVWLPVSLQNGDWIYGRQKIPEFLPCVSYESIDSVGAGILYSTGYGTAVVSGKGAKIVTDHVLYFDNWMDVQPETAKGVGYAGQYYFFTNTTGYIFQYGSGYFTDNKAPTFTTLTTIDEPDAVRLSWDGNILAAKGNMVYEWSIKDPVTPCGVIECCPYIWETKIHVEAGLSNMGAAKIVFEKGTGPVTLELFIWECGEKLKIAEEEFEHCNFFRLPAGYLTTDYSVRLSGCAVIKELHLDVKFTGLADA